MARTWPWSSGRGRPLSTLGTADRAFSDEALKASGCRDTQQAGDGDSTLGNDDFFASSGSLQPLAQMCSEIAYGYVHDHIVQLGHTDMYE